MSLRAFSPPFLLCLTSMAASPVTQYAAAAPVDEALAGGHFGSRLWQKWVRLDVGVPLQLAALRLMPCGQCTATGWLTARRR